MVAAPWLAALWLGGCWLSDDELARALGEGADESAAVKPPGAEGDADADADADADSGTPSETGGDTATESEDCDDQVGAVPTLTLTAVMADPSNVAQYYGEWFEVRNNSSSPVNLDGLTISRAGGAASFTVSGSLAVAPGTYCVFGVSADAELNGGVTVNYVYDFAEFDIDRADDDLALLIEAEVIDEVDWDSSWSMQPDAAHELSGLFENLEWANGLALNWCSATSGYGASGLAGTPGQPNLTCSGADVDADADGFTAEQGDCDDGDPAVHPCAVDDATQTDDSDCDGVRDDDG